MNGVPLPCRSFGAGLPACWIPTSKAKNRRKSGLLGSFAKRRGSGSTSTSHSSDSTVSDQLSEPLDKEGRGSDDKRRIEAYFCHASLKDANDHGCSTTLGPGLQSDCTTNELDFSGPETPAGSNGSQEPPPAAKATDTKKTPPFDKTMVDGVGQRHIPQFLKSDLLVGRLLGEGSFSNVFEVMVATADEEEPASLESLDVSRKDLSELIPTKFPGTISTAADDEDRVKAKGRDAKFEENKVNSGCDAGEEIDVMFGSADHQEIKQVNSGKNIEQGKRCNAKRECQHLRQRASSQSGTSKRRQTVDLCQPFSQKGPSQKEPITLAMKCLRPQIRSNAKKFRLGLKDLLHETAMLSSLGHPHIIKIQGHAAGCVSSTSHLDDGYFILLERLTDSLEDRIGSWRETMDRRAPPALSQIKTATCIADAMSYLHSRNIVFRDLKPANVGFDSRGVPKLFDFGVAIATKRLGSAFSGDRAEKIRGSLLYAACGTPRYAAPEVGLASGYGAPADVYSFGILFWEMCALKKPFDNFKSGRELRMATLGGFRPKLARSWPVVLRELMRGCWSSAPSERPRMASVKSTLAAHTRELLTKQDAGKAGTRRSFLLRRY